VEEESLRLPPAVGNRYMGIGIFEFAAAVFFCFLVEVVGVWSETT
jgi:hypothetical protein